MLLNADASGVAIILDIFEVQTNDLQTQPVANRHVRWTEAASMSKHEDGGSDQCQSLDGMNLAIPWHLCLFGFAIDSWRQGQLVSKQGLPST